MTAKLLEGLPPWTVSTLAPAMAYRLHPDTLEVAQVFATSVQRSLRELLDGSLSHRLGTLDLATDRASGSGEVGGGDDRMERLERLEGQVDELLTLVRSHLAQCPAPAEAEGSRRPTPRPG